MQSHILMVISLYMWRMLGGLLKPFMGVVDWCPLEMEKGQKRAFQNVKDGMLSCAPRMCNYSKMP